MESQLQTSEEQDALRTCAPGATVHGIDVSFWDGHVDWKQVKQSGKAFAFIRVSDGLHHYDNQFSTNWKHARQEGVIRSVYQYFRASQDPIRQADLLIEHVGHLGPGDLPAVVDIEEADGAPHHQITDHLKKWLERVEQGTGRKPIIYTAGGLWPSLGSAHGFNGYPLWVANYGARCPYMPEGWTHWQFWQYSSTSHVPGIHAFVDANVFNGTLHQLRALAHLQ
jgi:lysozyme